MTISTYNAPAADVLLDLGVEAGVSVAVPPGLEQEISIDLVDVPGEAAFRRIADLIDRDVAFDGKLVSFPPRGRLYEAFDLVDLNYESDVQLEGAIKSMMQGSGESVIVGDQILVAGTEDAVERARELAKQLERGPDGWVLEILVMQVSRDLRTDLGIGWALGAEAAAGFDGGIGNLSPEVAMPLFGARARGTVEMLARAVEDEQDAHLLTSATLYLLEGSSARFQNGETVPIAERQTSPEGTVRTVGYTYKETGFILDAKGQRVPDGLMLTLKPSISEITGYVEEAPVVAERTVEATAVVTSGDWLVLSGLDELGARDTRQGVPGWPKGPMFNATREETEQKSVIVLVRAIRVYQSGGTARGDL